MKKVFSLLLITGMVFSFMGSSCSSKEITSAKLYINQKKYDKALESLKEEVSKNAKSDEGYKLMGDVYAELSDFNNMVASYEKSLNISPKFEKEISIARQRRWADNFNKGAAYYNRGTKVTEKDSSKSLFLKSVEAFDEAIICAPDSAKSYEYQAYALFNLDQTENALKPLEKVTELAPNPEVFSRLGELTLQVGADYMSNFYSNSSKADSTKAMDMYRQAVKYLENGKKQFPNDPTILSDLSQAYVRANMTETAMSAFKEGVEKEPENKNYRYNYGVLLLGAKDFENAAVHFTKAVELDPTYENAIYNLGVTYIKWGALQREKAVESGNEDDMAYLEKYKLALPYLEKFLANNPENGQIWELLGKVYANLSMTKESENAFKKADEYK